MVAKSRGGTALHLFEALEEEYEALHGPLPAAYVRDWEFRGEEILDLDRLVERLRDRGDPAGWAIGSGLEPPARELLAAHGPEAGDAPSVELRDALAAELNRLLYDLRLTTRTELRSSIPGGVPEEVALLEKARFGGDELAKRNRLFLEAVFAGEVACISDVRLAAIYREIDGLPEPRTALCLSGGGIRSAVFSLGVVQGLARAGLLRGFDYLSTVSGGGYLGGFLAAWIHRHRDGIAGVSRDLAAADATPEPASRPARLDREPPPLRYLRFSSNYLSLSHGLLSAEAWTLVSTYLRNLYLHWTVVIPLVIAALLVPRVYLALVETAAGHRAWLPHLHFLLGSAATTWAIAYIGLHRPSGGLARGNQRTFLWYCLLPLSLGAVGFSASWSGGELSLPPWLPRLPLQVWLPAAVTMVGLGGWLVHVGRLAWRGLFRRRKLWELPPAVVSAALGGFLGLAVSHLLIGWSVDRQALYVVLGPPLPLLTFLAGETLFAGLVGRLTTDEDREWWARTAAWILIFIAAWAAIAGIAIFGPFVLLALPHVLAPLGGLAGLVSVLLAGSSWTAVAKGVGETGNRRLAELVEKVLTVSIPGFLLFFLALVSLVIDWLLKGLSGLCGDWCGEKPEPRTDALIRLLRLPEDSKLTSSLSFKHLENFFSDPPLAAPLLFVLAVALSLVVAYWMNINKFSLHAVYRSRLIRAFLGASRGQRDPNPFTGFDPADNLEMWELKATVFLNPESLRSEEWGMAVAALRGGESPAAAYLASQLPSGLLRELAGCALSRGVPADLVEELCRELNRLIRRLAAEEPLGRDFLRCLGATSDLAVWARRPPKGREERQRLVRKLISQALGVQEGIVRVSRPMPLINLCLNVAPAAGAAQPQPKERPFSVTPLHCGNWRAGYRPSERYGRGATDRAISLGTAMAISGAAASPNMGYHSSSVVRLLLTLFNARLGWWLGHPGMAGQHTYATSAPRWGIKSLLAEVLGINDPGYVYLSDGGHFDSLGLYEMVLRRCRRIVVCDATADKEFTFEHLGSAVRKIRVDLGVRIDFFAGLPIYAKGKDDAAGRYCAFAKIRYPQTAGAEEGCGELIYLKPAVYGREPRDICHYSSSHEDFPHEPAIDQWFSGSQFETYRMLGFHAVQEICGAGDVPCSLVDFFQRARQHAGA